VNGNGKKHKKMSESVCMRMRAKERRDGNVSEKVQEQENAINTKCDPRNT
jgi:hypothetical protein